MSKDLKEGDSNMNEEDEAQKNTSEDLSMTHDSLENPQAGPSFDAYSVPSTSGTQANLRSTASNRFATGNNEGDSFQEGTVETANIIYKNTSANLDETEGVSHANNYYTTGTLNVQGQKYPVVVFHREDPHRLVAVVDSHRWPGIQHNETSKCGSGYPLVTKTGHSIFMDATSHIQIASILNNDHQSSESDNVGDFAPEFNTTVTELVEVIPTLCEQYMNEPTIRAIEEIDPNILYAERSLGSEENDDISVGMENENIEDIAGVSSVQEEVLCLTVSKRKIEQKDEHEQEQKKSKFEGTGDDKDNSDENN